MTTSRTIRRKGSRLMTEHLPQPGMAGLRARLSNALQMAGQRRGRGSVWFAVVMWLLFGGVVWVGMLASAVASLHLSAAVANQGGGAAGAAGRREWIRAGPRALR